MMTKTFVLVLIPIFVAICMFFAYIGVKRYKPGEFSPFAGVCAVAIIGALVCLIAVLTDSFCPTCDRLAQIEDKHCGYCGTQIYVEAPATTCPDCGTETDTPFCTQCGAQVSGRENHE